MGRFIVRTRDDLREIGARDGLKLARPISSTMSYMDGYENGLEQVHAKLCPRVGRIEPEVSRLLRSVRLARGRDTWTSESARSNRDRLREEYSQLMQYMDTNWPLPTQVWPTDTATISFNAVSENNTLEVLVDEIANRTPYCSDPDCDLCNSHGRPRVDNSTGN